MKLFGHVTPGEWVWVAIIATAFAVEMLGLYRVGIPFTGGHFEPLSWGVEKNIERRTWVSMGLFLGLVALMVHWWTDLW